MKISIDRVVVERIEEEKKEGFEVVNVQDSFTYKGKVVNIPEAPVYMGNTPVQMGDVVLFAKYSPDSHELEIEGKKLKFVKVEDLLAVV